MESHADKRLYRLTVKDRNGNLTHLEIEADSPIKAKTVAGEQDSKLCLNEYVVLENVAGSDRQVISVRSESQVLVPGFYDDHVEEMIARQQAVFVAPHCDTISRLPADVQRDLRLRAVHAPPRTVTFFWDQSELALLQSEIALELAKLYVDMVARLPTPVTIAALSDDEIAALVKRFPAAEIVKLVSADIRNGSLLLGEIENARKTQGL